MRATPIPAARSDEGLSAADIALRVRAEQVRTQFASMPTSFLGSVFSATVYVAAAHGVLATWQWTLWLGLMLLQAMARGALWLAFRRARPDARDMPVWGRRAMVGSGVSGVIWGMGAVLVFPHGHIEFQLFFMFLIASMGSLSAIASASFLPAFYAYTFPTVLPVALLLLTQRDTLLQIMGVIALGYLPVISKFAHNLGDSVVESFRLRFENLELLQEITRRKEQAEDANREKSMFLAAASHDLRQPLHALSLQTHVLAGSGLSDDQRASVRAMGLSINAMTGLFDALLDVSRLDAGVVPVREQVVPLQRVLDQIREEFADAAQAKGLRLVLRGTAAHVRTDAHLLGSLLGNLVSNAVRYTARGGVLVGVRRRGESWCIQVWDTGVGIPADQQRAIFKPFYQVGNAERDRSKGLGLGLAIVDRLSALLGIPVRLTSVPGRGSCFSLLVPAAAPSRDAGVPWAAAPRAPAGPATIEGALVLVVDNEAEVRAAMTALLESWKCRVVSAGTADEALRRATALPQRPDVLLCDYRLAQGVNGLSVIARLRDEFNATLPALVVTGDTGADTLHEVRASGCQILHKPVRPDVLRRGLLELLAQPHEPAETSG